MGTSEITIPEEWHPNNDWSSHRPMLYMALEDLRINTIYEFGLGYGSTSLLCDYVNNNEGRTDCFSFESNEEWVKTFIEGYIKIPFEDPTYTKDRHTIIHTNNYLAWIPWRKNDFAFIDSAPGEQRKDIIKNFKDCYVVIVHDTEPGAEYVYGMADILSTFKYRCDLVIKGMPQTTAVSNVYDVSTWKGVYNEKFDFV